jgi:hypothetical protein
MSDVDALGNDWEAIRKGGTVTTDNGTSFADTIGNIFKAGTELAQGVKGVIDSTHTPKPATVIQYNLPTPVPAQQSQQNQSQAMSQQTMLLIAGGAVLLLLLMKH